MVGSRIKKRRLETGITQTELADKANISKQTLYKYENNVITNIPSDKIEMIARILNCSPGYLMGWENDTDNAYNQGFEEGAMIKKYSELSEANKQAVLTLIDNLLAAQEK